jgi:hypothetical protein
MTASPEVTTAADHLRAELAVVDLLLEREVVRLRDRGLHDDSEFRGLYVAEEHVEALLADRAGTRPRLRSARELALDGSIACAQADLPSGGPMDRLQARFGLGDDERTLLIVGAACELDLRYERLFAYAQNDVTCKRPTVELAMRLLADDLEGRARLRRLLDPGAPLRRHHLLLVTGDSVDPLPARQLATAPRVVDALLGHDVVDARLAPFTRLKRPSSSVDDLLLDPGLRAELPPLLAHVRREPAVLVLRGGYGSGRSSLAAAIAAQLEAPLLAVDLRGAFRTGEDIGEIMGLLAREVRLTGAAVLLEQLDVLLDEAGCAELVTGGIAELAVSGPPVMLSSRLDWHPVPPWPDVPVVTLGLGPVPYPVRVAAWRRELERLPAADAVAGPLLAGAFGLGPGQIRDAADEAERTRRLRGATRITSDDLHAAARHQSTHQLSGYARRIVPQRTWSDLVVGPKVREELAHVERHVRHRAEVTQTWGFAERLSLAAGVTVLFSGPSGTGKTLAAEILAHELRLELFAVDLSAVVSKYIGETEKQLDRVFDAAHDANAIIFFDEADATFGKRSEVTDAHDRYANIEVAYLLQRIERYEGVVVLATNLRRNIDEAFARRLQHTVEFALPRAAERRAILDLLLPAGLPVADDVDRGYLAERFELTGGNLRNVVIAAAFLARDEASPVTMRHLVLATARELEKAGRLATRGDFGPYFDLLHSPREAADPSAAR